jgi:hypothetical protein
VRAVAVAALVLLTACNGSPNQRPERQARATTTTSTTTTSSTLPSTTATTVRLVQQCRADDLGIVGTTGGGATGHTGLFVALENLSAQPCLLAGFPTALDATTPDGQPLTTFEKGVFFPAPETGILEASGGANGEVIIETTAGCENGPNDPPRRVYKDIEITLPGGGKLALGDFAVDGTCGVKISELGVVPQQ